MATTQTVFHASTVAIDGRAVLIEGPSGSGKSALALQLLALGATLIADDRTRVILREGWPWALAPERYAGVIEARGVGLVQTCHIAGAPLALMVDLGSPDPERMPERRAVQVLGHDILQLQRVDAAHFPSAIIALVKGGLVQDA